MSSLPTVFARKIIYRFFVFFIILTIIFLLPRLAPGTPIDYLVEDPRVPPEVRVELIKKFGLDKPIFPDQYFQFLLNFFLKFDLGYSFTYQEPVMSVISQRIIWSVILLGGALLISIPIGIMLGILMIRRRGVSEYLSVLGLLFLRSFPVFWVGMILLLIFSYYLKVFPLGGAMSPGVVYNTPYEYIIDVLKHLTLPLITLSAIFIPRYALLMRSSSINVIREDFVFVAVAKGLPRREILYSYIARNSMLPVITTASIDIGFIAGGAVVTETVYSYPGMGTLIYTAVINRDYPLLLGSFAIVTAVTLIAVTIAEFLYTFIDPRVKSHEI
ncbi:MAG: ABC transporter permease [Sulfolobales archaeon]